MSKFQGRHFRQRHLWKWASKDILSPAHAGTLAGNRAPRRRRTGPYSRGESFFHRRRRCRALKHAPEVDYTDLRATVCAESDNYAEGKEYEVAVLPDPPVPIEVLIIDAGDDYRLDFLARNTVIDLNKGIPVVAASSAAIRDDRPTLNDLARVAFEWYRRSPSHHRRIPAAAAAGESRQLVTTIGDGTTQSTINTVVSAITYDFSKARRDDDRNQRQDPRFQNINRPGVSSEPMYFPRNFIDKLENLRLWQRARLAGSVGAIRDRTRNIRQRGDGRGIHRQRLLPPENVNDFM